MDEGKGGDLGSSADLFGVFAPHLQWLVLAIDAQGSHKEFAGSRVIPKVRDIRWAKSCLALLCLAGDVLRGRCAPRHRILVPDFLWCISLLNGCF